VKHFSDACHDENIVKKNIKDIRYVPFMMNGTYIFLVSVSVILILAYTNNAFAEPTLKDSTLKVQEYVSGLTFPTSMVFLDNSNLLVLEKNGNVRLVSDGTLEAQPILSLPVVDKNERGLLGIEKDGSNIFIYATVDEDGVKNRVYKYELKGTSLSNPQVILDLPASPGTNHQGGKLVMANDSTLYSVTGELQRNGKDQNIQDGPDPDYSGAILKINPDGTPASGNPFNDSGNEILQKYTAYGVRNCFGLAIDPKTGALWDTENGEDLNDEINFVFPGFNSGWKLVMGPISQSGQSENELVKFPGSKYKDPIITFKDPIGITDIEFLKSDKLGAKYSNNAFVGDYVNGNLYRFELNDERNDFKLNSPGLADRVVDDESELDSILLGTGFEGITDIATGPDGNLYVLSYKLGEIFKITL
jgi:aldose sugar dehydrogenase